MPETFAQSKPLQYDSQGRGISPDDRDGLQQDKPSSPDFEPGEILVMDPSEGLEGRAITLGFGVIENVVMENLSIRMLRLSTPKGMSVPEAIQRLSREFPDDEIDSNTLFELNSGSKRLGTPGRAYVFGDGPFNVRPSSL